MTAFLVYRHDLIGEGEKKIDAQVAVATKKVQDQAAAETAALALRADTAEKGAASAQVESPNGVLHPPSRVWSALVALCATQLVIVIFMCLKRLRAAYRELTI